MACQETVLVTTLGEYPHNVLQALDALRARGAAMSAVIVLSLHHCHDQAALSCLERALHDQRNSSRPCRLEPVLIDTGSAADSLSHCEYMTDAAYSGCHQVLRELKARDATIHLCLTGGHHMLELLAFGAAQLYFDQHDRVWLLGMPPATTTLTSESSLVRLPLVPWGQLFPALRPGLQSSTLPRDPGEHQRCAEVWSRLTARQREVLQVLAAGATPQEASIRLAITLATLHTHKTTIYQECCIAWGLPVGTRLSYGWLRERFAASLAML